MSSAWRVVRIGDLFKTGAGGTPLKSRKEFYQGGEIPWLMSGEVSSRDIEHAKHFITETGLNNSSAKIFPKDTVLVAMYGATAGQAGILRINAATNQAVCGIYPSEEALPEYLYYALLSISKELVAKAAGNAQPNISQAKIKNTEIFLPSLAEQKRIVSILDEAFTGIDAAIANTEKNLANARELFESYLSSVFSSAPLHWQKSALSDICSIKHGFAFKSEYFSDAGPFIVLTPGSFYESGGFRDQGKKTKFYVGDPPADYILNKDDFLIAMTEQAAGLLGSSLVVPESRRFLHNQRLGLVVVRDGVDWHNDFFFHQFNTHGFRSAVQETASGVKVRHTSPGKLGAIQVFVPSYSEQVEIGEKLNMLLSEVRKLESLGKQKLESLTELKKSLLQKAFSGELTDDLAEKELDEAVA